MTDRIPTGRLPTRSLVLYALAWAGGAIAYVPFLTILLPVRVSALAGDKLGISWLAYIAFAGAIAASLTHIGFGYLSDITRNRRTWIGFGLALSCGMLMAMGHAESLFGLIGLIILWQLALNMMLAPLAAWAGDCVPDSQKGLLGGLLAFAPGLGALSSAFITLPDLFSADERLMLVAIIVMFCVLPVLISGMPAAETEPAVQASTADQDSERVGQPFLRSAMLRMWLARLAVQVSEAALFSYLYFWFRSIDPAMDDSRTARIFSIILILSAPVALYLGRWADRHDRPVVPLIACAALSSVALVGMAMAQTLPTAIGAYAIFGFASSIFLSLHSAQTLRVLPRPDRRGRDLGLFNLTNTLPSLIMPGFTLALVPYFGFSGLFVVLSVLALVAGLTLGTLVRRL